MRDSFDRRTDDEEVPLQMIWDGKHRTALKISAWARNSAYNTRFTFNALSEYPARTLVEPPFPDSPEWVVTPVGSVIRRQSRDEDAPLTVVLPPKVAKVEEQAA